jgi:hypothetical protein
LSRKEARKLALSARALDDLDAWIARLRPSGSGAQGAADEQAVVR